jgi:hypothetical protein
MIKEKDIVFVLSSSAIVAFIWIGSSLYHSYITSTIHEPLSTLIQPISPKFNTRAMQHISQRQVTNPTYERTAGISSPTPGSSSASAAVIPSPTIAVTEIPVPTEGSTP